jgi:hypothetical protein
MMMQRLMRGGTLYVGTSHKLTIVLRASCYAIDLLHQPNTSYNSNMMSHLSILSNLIIAHVCFDPLLYWSSRALSL